MNLSTVTLTLVLSLCLPQANALRGVRSPKKEEGVTESVEEYDLLPPGRRSLVEEVPCMPWEWVPQANKDEPLSGPCKTNQCGGGCCRYYYWLVCDRDNNFPDIPCICNANTQDPADFGQATAPGLNQVTAPPTTNAPISNAPLTIVPATSAPASNAPTTSAPATNVPATPEYLALSGDTTNVTYTANVTVVASAFDGPVEFHDEGVYVVEAEKEQGGGEDEFHDEGAYQVEGEVVISGANEAPPTVATAPPPGPLPPTNPPTSTPLTVQVVAPPPSKAPVTLTPQPTISPDACQNGSPYEGVSAFDGYVSCKTSLDCEGMATISRASQDTNNHDVLTAETMKKKDDSKESESEDESPGQQGVANDPVLSAQETPVESGWCCLANMCLCGIPEADEWTKRCVPPYVVPATPSPTVAPPTTSRPPVPGTPIPNPITTQAPVPPPTFVAPTTATAMVPPPVPVPATPAPVPVPDTPVPATPASANPAPTMTVGGTGTPADTEEQVPYTDTACSGGSWYHLEETFTGYRKCVTSRECREVAEDQCCLLNFCFCGKVEEAGSHSVCVPV